MTERISPVCWHCGAAQAIEGPHRPRFAFELAAMANDAGMKGFLDGRCGRALVFCSVEHAKAEMTKQGQFRAYPRGAKGVQGGGES